MASTVAPGDANVPAHAVAAADAQQELDHLTHEPQPHDDTTVELYGARTGNSIRAAIALEEAGIPYIVKRLDLGRGEQRSPGYLGLNPAGKVPTLRERRNGEPVFVLSQSNAIVLHAAARGPDTLLPRDDATARSLVLERFFFFVTDVIAPSHAAFFLAGQDSRGAALCHARACDAIALAETFLADARFVAGRAFTIADIAAVTIVAHLDQSLDWSKLPNLRQWFEETRARPAVERGFHAFDPSM